MRLLVFVLVFVLGALVSAFLIDDFTVCPVLQEGESYQVRITVWPPLALTCEGETYVPWWQWLCVAISAAGVALFSFSPARAYLSLLLVVGGVLGWFDGAPF